MISSSIARLLVITLVSSTFPHPLIAQTKDDTINASYVICKPQDIPTQDEVVNCVKAINLQWQGYLISARSQQDRLIYRQSTSDVFQWVAVGGGAAAAGLGVSSDNKSVAVAVGGAALVSAVFSILFKGEKIGQRIDACSAIIANQYKVDSIFSNWILSSADQDFRKEFKNKVSAYYDDLLIPSLKICMPNEKVNKA